MDNHITKYYPVGNGDTILIKLKSKITIINDCNIRKVADDIYDVKEDLLKELEKKDDKPFTDLFILSHHDQDHCLGFEKHFHCGDINKYAKGDDKIIIDELWVNSFILSDDISKNSSAYDVKKEVERRRNLYKNNNSNKNDRGNRLVLIGSDEDDNFKNVPQYFPGNEYSELNGDKLNDISFFIHAPLKQSIIEGNAQADRNATSIVYQAKFKNDNGDIIGQFIHGGDSDHYRWKIIKEKSEKNEHQEALNWDVFLAPHHCSWTFFNNTPYKDEEKNIDNSTPQKSSLDILDYANEGAWIVTSSKEIKNNSDNPPHYPARTEYINKIGETKFKNTQKIYEDRNIPIIFEIGENGLTVKNSVIATGISIGKSKTPRAGQGK